ncbi:hypothetical protein EIP86_007665 [Pleurotus ostreatoroseus]|nr:hypothetical protein EIP86_007665 [Pleurotus ostreatoroseus]
MKHDSMPPYLNKVQLFATVDETPIYDAREYFTGNKVDQAFVFGVTDLQCPRLQREIRKDEFIAVVHSISTFLSKQHGGHGLSFNVYYGVLLASPLNA